MLVRAAQQAGFKPLAIDLYGDQDTCWYAEETQQIHSLAEKHLMPALDYFVNHYPVTCVVYGCGFEQQPDSLKSMGDRLTLLGNQAGVFAKLHDKAAFFSLLNALAIPYPDVAFHNPGHDVTDLLIKPMHGQGGVGIRRCRTGEAAEPSTYWQKYQEGVPHSVLFLADGIRSQIIGFNRQWTTPLNDKDEFIFSGIINSTELSLEQKNQISDWVDKLVAELSLKGLNSLDFIQHGQTSYVLEINPRPPASMQLYDADLFARHIKACQGELLDYKPVQAGFTAYQIVYAQRDTLIPDGFEWPDGVMDMPNAGSIISTGQPICSMITHEKEPQQVLEQLKNKQELITYHTTGFKLMEYSASVNKLTQPLVQYLIDNAG
ncbi:MAG: ATP-grasp domain-containing protein, partial [Methyloglobulus sp.]|nr:ATP-grasp domain-containing protein [Methyloglobulus sp.]